MSRDRLDQACEQHLAKAFGQEVDFAIERSLPELLSDGLVTQHEVRSRTGATWPQRGTGCQAVVEASSVRAYCSGRGCCERVELAGVC